MSDEGAAERASEALVGLARDPAGGRAAAAAAGEVPGNALKQVAALGLQKAGDLVVDPKTVLVWLLGALGAPAALAGLLVPIREAGSMLPQAALAGWVRRRPVRTHLWVWSGVAQAAAAAGLAVVALTVRGTAAGVAVLLLLAAFASARALSSIVTKDVLGKTVPKGRRGRVTGSASVASGVVAITLGVALRTAGGERSRPGVFALLLAGAALAWLAASAVYASVVEEPGESDGRDDPASALRRAWALLRGDGAFRRFVLARGLLLVSALSPPFVVALANQRGGSGLRGLGPFVISSGIAALVGGRLWGPLADRSSRRVVLAAAAAATTVLAGLLVVLQADGAAGAPLVLPACYLLLALAHEGARIGRKTYVVDLAEGNDRTDYVAVSNSAMAVVLLLAGALTAAAATAGPQAGLAVLAGVGLLAVVVARTLPEISRAG